MTSTVLCRGCGKSYEISFLRWQNADLCKECFDKGVAITGPPRTLPPLISLPIKIVAGIVWALGGLFIYLWASRHSPYNPLGAMMAGGLENYVLKEPFYTVILLAAAGLGLLGISLLVLGLIDRAKLP